MVIAVGLLHTKLLHPYKSYPPTQAYRPLPHIHSSLQLDADQNPKPWRRLVFGGFPMTELCGPLPCRRKLWLRRHPEVYTTYIVVELISPCWTVDRLWSEATGLVEKRLLLVRACRATRRPGYLRLLRVAHQDQSIIVTLTLTAILVPCRRQCRYQRTRRDLSSAKVVSSERRRSQTRSVYGQ